MSDGTQTTEDTEDRLLRHAWIMMHPEKALREIEAGMVRTGVSTNYYKFNSLTPLYPTMQEKLRD